MQLLLLLLIQDIWFERFCSDCIILKIFQKLICSSKLIARNKLWMISSLLWSVHYCNCRSVYDSLCVPPLLQCKAAITITHLSVNNREEDIKADHKDSWLITTSSIDMHTLTHALLSSFSFDHLYNIMYHGIAFWTHQSLILIIPVNHRKRDGVCALA